MLATPLTAQEPKLRGTLIGHTDRAASVAWSPDGKSLASVGDDGIKLWDVGTGRNIATLTGNQEWVNSVAWSPDGKQVL